jgi:hypothetical protein
MPTTARSWVKANEELVNYQVQQFFRKLKGSVGVQYFFKDQRRLRSSQIPIIVYWEIYFQELLEML